ncbi:NADPH:quinone oxidoreductase family protein [Microbacterium sp. A93]|uniref:NADPH:quinone oxidoreductase family protein n=1 Tax=Microbacterium sp. A93 TaxID=3450716 RepID=UPI003F421603
MTKMRAWQISKIGVPLESMVSATIERPVPGPGQILVKVRAVSLNFPDVLMAMGQYQMQPSLPFVPGVELCGDVVDGTTDLPAGTRVMGIAKVPDGALAEYAICEAGKVFPAPDVLSDAEAASFTIAFHTAWLALHHRGRIVSGETLLVHAAAGGVGSAATILGKAAGARVIAVVGGEQKSAIALKLGADEVVDRLTCEDEDALIAALREHIPAPGADIAFDPVGGSAFRASMKLLAPDGRLAVIGFAGGEIPSIGVNRALLKNIDIMGIYWGGYINTTPSVVAEAAADLSRLIVEKNIRPYISEIVGFLDAAAACEKLRQGASSGRIVVSLG